MQDETLVTVPAEQLDVLQGRSMEELEVWMLGQEQAPYEIAHHFGPSIYIREASVPAGSIVLGHAHKEPHMVVLLEGKMAVLMDGKIEVVVAPKTWLSSAGRKLAYVMEDLTIQNIYATDLTDVDELEVALIDKSNAWREHELEEEASLLLYAVGEAA
jgi:uncharacterized cupin superfamily protein